MKKIIITVMALTLALTAPVSCFASSATNWQVEEEYVSQGYKFNYTEKEKAVYVKTIYKYIDKPEQYKTYNEEDYIVTFKPAEVSAKAYSNSIKVNAEITTAARRVVVQYSTDKNFAKNVTTKTFKNSSYVDDVTGKLVSRWDIRYDARGNATSIDVSHVRAISQGKTGLTYRKGLPGEAVPSMTDEAVRAARAKVSNKDTKKTFTISNVKNGEKYYVRIRGQFAGFDKIVYSNWATVKVTK